MTKTIMIVDDEPHILELVQAILESEGYKVVSASDGNEALKKLKSTTPDLVILDMMMPGMSGREVCEKIRENPKTKDLKVMFLTVAKFSEAGKDILSKLKVVDYVTKPFENKVLVEHVKDILNT